MPIERNRRSTRDMAAALAVLGASSLLAPAALAQAAGSTTGASGVQSAIGQPELTPLDAAAALAADGKFVQARSVLDRLARSERLGKMSDAQRARALNLLKDVDAKLRTADPMDMGLQKAELGVLEGDLLLAERHAQAVSRKSYANAEQKLRAQQVLSQVQARRTELAPMVDGLIEQAKADFAAGKYPAAKAGLLTLLRSGIELGADKASQLESYQLQIVELERQRGESFEVEQSGGLGMMQPGTVRRPETPPLPEVPPAADAPANAAAGDQPVEYSNPPAVQPVQSPAPAPAAAPQAAPRPQPQYTPAFEPWTFNGGPHREQPQPAVQPAPAVAPAEAPAAAAPAPAQPAPAPQDDLITLAMKAEAQRFLAEGDQAFEQARYSVAVEKYTVALTQFRQYLTPGDADRADKRRAEANQRLGASTPNSGISQVYTRSVELQQQQARAQFNNEVEQARARLGAGDPAKAQELAARARLTITNARGAFAESEYDGFIRQLDDLNKEIEARREALAKDEAAKREVDLKEKAKVAESNRVADRDRKVGEAIDRVRALQVERKYREALQVTEQALFLDPNNPTALLLRDFLRDLAVYERYNRIQAEKQYGHVVQSLNNEEEMIPPQNMMEYPSDWPAKTFQRGEVGAFADTPENRAVLARMNNAKTEVAFTDNPLSGVLEFLAKTNNLNIDADWESLASVGVEKETPVTLKLPKVTIETALNRVLAKVSKDQFAKAGWAVSEGVVTIASEEQLRKNKSLVIYNIQDLLFVIPNHPDVPQIDLTSVLQQGQGGSGQSPFTNTQNQRNQTPEQIEQQRRERIRQIQDIIQQNVDPEGWADNGGDTGRVQELNGSLIITNTPKNHREIVGLLSKLREIRNMQINVETKFLLVNQNWFEQIGFDLDIVFNTNSRQVQTAQTTNPNTLPSDFFNFGGPFGSSTTPRGLRRIITSPNAAGTNVTQGVAQPNSFSPIGGQQGSLDLANSLAEGDFANSILRQAPALGIAGQFLDDIQVDFLIQATQADKRTVQLTAPRLTFTNGQTSNIFVVTQQAFVSDLQPITGDSAVGFDPTVSVVSEGVTMLIEGVVSADRRYVTMNVDAGVARIDGFAQQAVSAIAGGQLVNSAATQSFIQLPTVTVTRVRTTAIVPDEGTLLIGGQRLITEVEVETGVPILSKIPIINRFFTNRLESKEEQTLLVLLKPTILIQSEQEERAFPGLLESVRSGVPLR